MSTELVLPGDNYFDLPEVAKSRLVVDLSEKEAEHVKALGAVTYANGGRVAYLGIGADRKLLVEHHDTPANFDEVNETSWRKRVVRLDHLEQVGIHQIDLTDVTVRHRRNPRSAPYVTTELPYYNTDTGKISSMLTEEDQLLRMFTRETGRVVLFEGAGLDVEMALVRQEIVRSARVGMVYLFHPSDTAVDIESMLGMEQFMNRLVSQYRSLQIKDPFTEKYLAKFDKGMSNGQLAFVELVRRYMFEFMVIAHGRMHEISTDYADKKRHKDFLDEHLGHISNWAKYIKASGDAKGYIVRNSESIRRSNQAVDVFIDQDIIGGGEPDYVQGLKTVWAKRLRIAVNERYALDGPGMENFLCELARTVHTSYDVQLGDIVKLAEELRRSRYSQVNLGWKFVVDGEKCDIDTVTRVPQAVEGYPDYAPSASEALSRIIRACDRRKIIIEEQRVLSRLRNV